LLRLGDACRSLAQQITYSFTFFQTLTQTTTPQDVVPPVAKREN
jgi:hypothetical protein